MSAATSWVGHPERDQMLVWESGRQLGEHVVVAPCFGSASERSGTGNVLRERGGHGIYAR